MKLYERDGVFVLEPLTSDQARQLAAMAAEGGFVTVVPAVVVAAGGPEVMSRRAALIDAICGLSEAEPQIDRDGAAA